MIKKYYYKNNNLTTWVDKGYHFSYEDMFKNEDDALFHANSLSKQGKDVVILGFSLSGNIIYQVGYK